MANITNVTVTSGTGTLLSGGTGTYNAIGEGIQCGGSWDSPPSVRSTYTISFQSDDSSNQSYNDCYCNAYGEDPSSGNGTGTFTIQG